MTFDSDAFPQAAGAQTQFVNTACSSGSFFDFANNVYYLDVELTKAGAGGTPAGGEYLREFVLGKLYRASSRRRNCSR